MRIQHKLDFFINYIANQNQTKDNYFKLQNGILLVYKVSNNFFLLFLINKK